MGVVLSRLSPWGRTWLARGLAAVGFGLVGLALLRQGVLGDGGGGGGVDAYAYWAAARAMAEGGPVYGIPPGTTGAYSYAPPLAQLLAPVAGLPIAVFVWSWRLVEVLCLRYAVGSWTRAGIAMLFPPVLVELDAGNIHLVMAAVCALAMRGAAGAVGPSGLLKFASVPLLPLGWSRDRRGLLLGIAAAAAVVAGSYAIAPARWQEWLAFLPGHAFPSGGHNIAEALPLWLRLGFAAALGFAAVRWPRLAPVAVLLAYPVVWFDALSTLVAVFAPLAATAANRSEPRTAPAEAGPRAWQEVPS